MTSSTLLRAQEAAIRIRARPRSRLSRPTRQIALYAILIIGAVIISIPWTWMILSALKTNAELHEIPLRALPAVPQWDNFLVAFFISGQGCARTTAYLR